jgi:DNA-binding NtrC family response regulator
MKAIGNSMVITYNGLDGACAAAAVLLKRPEADIVISSASRIGATFDKMQARDIPPAEIHVCGVGIWCDFDELMVPARKLVDAGSNIHWYCGRGYLDSMLKNICKIGRPIFMERVSNTEAICEYLDLLDTPSAARLVRLSKCDPHNKAAGSSNEIDKESQFWIDFIDASIGQYFKYQDTDAYQKAIRKLAVGSFEECDRRMVAVYRRHGMRHILKGNSTPMRRLRQNIRKCADADEHVLITGESGVGKEYVAHLLHEGSSRAMAPMIPVNCAVFTGNLALANSTLFGHLKGAFTGASADREGAFAAADGGILFLDEIGELPLEVQAKILRVLEDGAITPEGADRPVRQVDVIVIGATNRDLTRQIEEGNFRVDLYHRMDTLHLSVPPLRQHPEDIAIIARDILKNLGGKDTGAISLSKKDLLLLQNYHWPGNVRQLIKVLKRAYCLDLSILDVLKEEQSRFWPEALSRRDNLMPDRPGEICPIDMVKKIYARQALMLLDGNKAEAARKLGIAVNTLKSYIE